MPYPTRPRYAITRQPFPAYGVPIRLGAPIVTSLRWGTLPDSSRGSLILTARPRTLARRHRRADSDSRYAVTSVAYILWHNAHHGRPEDGCEAWHGWTA